MTEDRNIVVTGLGVELPGISAISGFLDLLSSSTVASEARPEARLGNKGLRYKDRATKLALAAAQATLEHAGLPSSPHEQLQPDAFGVVASSNLGNLDTVCRVVEAIRSSGVDAISPMDLPNASSNVISASIGIWFGLKGLNLMICNGATSGTDALYIAANSIRAGRAEHMIVVGVETVNPAVARLIEESAQPWLPESSGIRLGDCAGAVILESAGSAAARNAYIYGRVGAYAYAPQGDVRASLQRASLCDESAPDLWLTPNCSYGSTFAQAESARTLWKTASPTTLDIAKALGETYGATGVLQTIAACLWLDANRGRKAIATSGAAWGDGAASLVIRGGRPS